MCVVCVMDREECEEAHGELLSLYDAERQQSVPLQVHAAGVEYTHTHTHTHTQ